MLLSREAKSENKLVVPLHRICCVIKNECGIGWTFSGLELHYIDFVFDQIVICCQCSQETALQHWADLDNSFVYDAAFHLLSYSDILPFFNHDSLLCSI